MLRPSVRAVLPLLLASAAAAQNLKLSGPLAHSPGSLGGDVRALRYTPDGSRVVYTADGERVGSLDLYSAPADGSAPAVRLSDTAPGEGSLAVLFEIAPDSRHVAFVPAAPLGGERRLSCAALDGSAPAVELASSVMEFHFTPDGSALVYNVVTSSWTTELRRVSIDGGGTNLTLAVDASSLGSVLVAPDGQHLVYTTGGGGSSARHLWSVRTDGTQAPVALASASGSILSKAVSADSSWVVFLTSPPSSFATTELWAVPLDGGSAALELSPSSVSRVGAFRLSPDAQRVVFSADQGAGLQLFGVPIDGSASVQQLSLPVSGQSRGLGGDADFQLTPDGARVVFRANSLSGQRYELFVVSAAGGVAAPLSGPLVPGGIVLGFQVTPDSIGVVFRAEKDALGVQELYAVPFAGEPFKLSGPLVSGGDVLDFQISPDDLHVVYRADRQVNDRFELYRVAITGGASTRLNAAVSAGSVAEYSLISPDSARVAYLADHEASGVVELFEAFLLGGAAPLKLSAPLAPGPPSGDVRRAELAPDGDTIVYAADGEVEGRVELYRTTRTGGVVVKLSEGDVPGSLWIAPQDAWECTADGARVVYLANLAGFPELFSAPLDASAPPVKLNHALTTTWSERGVRAFELSRDGSHVLYRVHESAQFADLFATRVDGQGTPVRLSLPGQNVLPQAFLPEHHISPDGARVAYRAGFDLYGVPLDGSTPAVRLDGPLVAGGGVAPFFQIGADGRTVLFRADARVDERIELYSVPLDGRGTARPVRLSGPTCPGGDVRSLALAPQGGRAVYLADQEVDGRFELYSVPIGGARHAARPDGASAFERVKFSPTLAAGETVLEPLYSFTPDGSCMVFQLDRGVGVPSPLFVAPLDGSRPATQLATGLDRYSPPTPGLPRIGPDGVRAAYIADQALFSVPLDASHAPVRLDLPLISGWYSFDLASDFLFSPDARWIVYLSEERTGRNKELFARRSDGAGSRYTLSGEPQSAGNVALDSASEVGPPNGSTLYLLTPDSRQVLYLADQELDEVVELYASSLPMLP